MIGTRARAWRVTGSSRDPSMLRPSWGRASGHPSVLFGRRFRAGDPRVSLAAMHSRFAIAVALAACAPAAAPCPPSSDGAPARDGEAPRAPAHEGERPRVAGSIAGALAEAGHRCAASRDDAAVVVCEPDTPGLVPFVVVESPPIAIFAAYFKHRPAVACPELAPLLNELNAKADDLKVVCEGERTSFVTSFALPSRGFTRDEVADLARRYQALIQLMLGEESLRAALE